MHSETVASNVASHKYLENDPEYYPFSYVLGKKVSVWNSTEHDFSEKADWRYAMLDRSSDVKCYKNWTDGEAKYPLINSVCEDWRGIFSSDVTEIAQPT